MGGTSHRCQPLRRRVRARVRNPGGRRAHARADDEHPHGGRRRRLDPAVRRRALARRARKRRRQPGAGLLSARRAAGGDRRQRDARPHPAARTFPRCSARAATSRSTRERGRASSPRWPPTIKRGTGRDATPESLAAGFVADRGAATWPTRSSRSRWRAATTSRSYTLQCFGGAGGQHACAVADALGMTRVFVHPLAGVLSAYGMGLADQIAMREAVGRAAARRRRPGGGADAPARARRRGARRAARAGRAPTHRSVRERVHVRYEGTDTALVVAFGAIDARCAPRSRRRIASALRS